MKPRLQALRAIGSTFGLDILYSAAIWSGVAVVVLIGITWLLAYFFSSWWWLLAIPVGLLTLVALVVWLVAWTILRRLQPILSKNQQRATKQFIQKARRLFENATTPYPILAFRLVFDTVTRRREGLLTELLSDSKGLRGEFDQVVKEF